MSDNFKVNLTKIRKILPHPNAERLEIAEVYGFNVAVQKGRYVAGDLVLYVPIDSVLSPAVEAIVFPPDSKIKLHNSRVKQIRIRSVFSQGLIVDPETVAHLLKSTFHEERDYAEELGITKYEPPTPEYQTVKQPKLRSRAKNSYFREYNGINNIKWYPETFEGEEVIVTEKAHGCLRNFESIELTDGSSKTIQEIVDNKLNVEIWGYNEKTNKIVPTRVINWLNSGPSYEWLKISFTKKGAARGHYYGTVQATPNHQFFLPKTGTYEEARNLKPDDEILFKRDDYVLSYIQKQILIGKMLGDGSLNGNRITFGHKKEHETYLDYTLSSLGEIGGNRAKNQTSGYGTEMVRGSTISNPAIRQQFQDWFINNIKQVPESAVNDINPIALAFWYMDDGSLSTHVDQQDRASFAVCAFDEKSVDNLLTALKRFGVVGVKHTTSNKDKSKHHWRIRLNADEAEKFYLLVAPYIHPCMRYKLPVRYRELPFIELPRIEGKYKSKTTVQKIISVEKMTNKGYNLNKYDIETETGNFFVKGVLVHNSHIRFSKTPFEANTLWKKLLKFLRLAPDHEKVYGSNRVQIEGSYKGYYGEDIYGAVLKKIKAFDKIKVGEFVHGEIIGPGIQKNYDYGFKEHFFVMFDVRVLQPDGTQKWLNPEEAEAYAAERGFAFVPVLYRGPYSKEIVDKCTVGPSCIDPNTKVREGCVVKSRYNYDDNQNKRALKSINPEYLSKDQTDFH